MQKKKDSEEYISFEKYHIKWTKDAKKDLREILIFIAKQNPQTALKIHKKIKTKADSLDHFPYRGSLVPELLALNIRDYRQITESTWKIIYKIDKNIVNILTIVDSRRDLYNLLKEKFLSPDFWE